MNAWLGHLGVIQCGNSVIVSRTATANDVGSGVDVAMHFSNEEADELETKLRTLRWNRTANDKPLGPTTLQAEPREYPLDGNEFIRQAEGAAA